MAQSREERKKLITPAGRLTFPSVFTKATPMEDDASEPKYEATIVWNVDDIRKNKDELARYNAIKVEMERVCMSDFKKSMKDCKVKIAHFHDPIRDGVQKEHLEGYGAGTLFAKAKSKKRPGVITTAGVKINDPEALYSGCYVRLNITPFAYGANDSKKTRGGKGVSFALNSVLFVKDGDRLDGTSNAAEDFGEMVDALSEGDEAGDSLL